MSPRRPSGERPLISALEVTRLWLGIVITGASLLAGLLSYVTSYILQGARLGQVETSLAAHVAEAHERREKIDAQMHSLEVIVSTQTARSDVIESKLGNISERLSEIHGQLAGSTVSARGRAP